MSTTKFYIQKREIEKILEVMKENNVDLVELIHTDGGGIGSNLDVEFDFTLNDRPVVVRATITDETDW